MHARHARHRRRRPAGGQGHRAPPEHALRPDDPAITDGKAVAAARIRRPHRITDACLLGLAVGHGGRFATFDAGSARSAVLGAQARHLLVP
ncbi:MAG: hypothetical protein KJ018_14430 [Burkholderiales bacterium]|nr:hypothetical protein [Burkholderiales bacterium]